MEKKIINIISYKKANIYNNNDVIISIKYEEVVDGKSNVKECFISSMPIYFKEANEITKQDLKLFINRFTFSTEKMTKLVADLYLNKIDFIEVLSENINE